MRRALIATAFALCLLDPTPAHSSSFLQRRMTDWVKELNTSDTPAKRSAAAFALGRMGSDAEPAIPDLAKKAATDRDASVRDSAAAAIGSIILALDDKQAASHFDTVRRNLLAALADEDARVRRSAAYALGAFGKAGVSSASNLVDCLSKDRSAGVRQNAAWALGRLGAKDRATFAALSDALRDSSPQVRRDAAGALHTLGAESERAQATETAKRLLEMIKEEKDDSARKTALNALSVRVGPEHAGAVGDILPFAESKDEDTARVAAQVLGRMGAAEELGKLLSKSKDNKVRSICCVALSHLRGERGKPGVAALVAALKPTGNTDRASEEVREYAAEALAQIGYPSNEAAIPAIRTVIMEDKNEHVRHRSVWALFNITDLEKYRLVEPLTKVLDEPGDHKRLVRYDAARVLAFSEQDKAPDKVVEILLQMLADPKLKVFKKSDADVRGGDEKDKGKTNINQDLGGDARYMAAQALTWMGNKAKNDPKVMDALRAAAKDMEPTLKAEAEKALLKLGG